MRVLFVCTGNICRSPTVQAVFRHFAAEAKLDTQADSAGTRGFHFGARPDARAVRAANSTQRELSLSSYFETLANARSSV